MTELNWTAIGLLSELKYLNFREGYMLSGNVTDHTCNLTQLLFLDFQLTSIESLPDCIGTDLQQLGSLSLRGTSKLSYITPKIFTELPNLVMVTAFWSIINTSSIPTDDGWKTNNLKSVFLQTTATSGPGACLNMDELNEAQIEFINYYHACDNPCEGNVLHQKCSAYNWGDGKCNDHCCDYDGGDCHQLCPCNVSLWFNDRCDPECNISLCAYDFGSCIMILPVNMY